ncbi:hypothetical protein ScPMuIL_016312 [Solemya velum]
MANTFNGIRTKEEETVIRPAASKEYGEHRGGDRALARAERPALAQDRRGAGYASFGLISFQLVRGQRS